VNFPGVENNKVIGGNFGNITLQLVSIPQLQFNLRVWTRAEFRNACFDLVGKPGFFL
jgi:hypothetical protein